MRKYLDLFFVFLRVGAFTFGGGYAMVPIIQKEIVEEKQLVKEEEFLDIIAVAQSFPGPIAVNASVFTGYKLFGLNGAIFALLGTVLPSFFSILILAFFYNTLKDIEKVGLFFKGVRPAIVSLILFACIKMSKSIKRSYFNFAIIFCSFIAIIFLNIHPILVIIFSAFMGILYQKRRAHDDIS